MPNSAVAHAGNLAKALLQPIMPVCGSGQKTTGDLWHERRSGFLGDGGAFAGAGVRRRRHHAQALAAGLCESRRGQMLRTTGGYGRALSLSQAGHPLLPH